MLGRRSTDTGTEEFTLDEGRVTITYPATISDASLKDLYDYLAIFFRKRERANGGTPKIGLDPTRTLSGEPF